MFKESVLVLLSIYFFLNSFRGWEQSNSKTQSVNNYPPWYLYLVNIVNLQLSDYQEMEHLFHAQLHIYGYWSCRTQ